VILLSSCDHAPKKPVGDVFMINARPTKEPEPYALSFNLSTDFNDDLQLIPGHLGVHKPVTIDSLHKNWCMDDPTKNDLVRYSLEWKQRYLKLKEDLNKCESGQ
jgi:hypothetical protein